MDNEPSDLGLGKYIPVGPVFRCEGCTLTQPSKGAAVCRNRATGEVLRLCAGCLVKSGIAAAGAKWHWRQVTGPERRKQIEAEEDDESNTDME